MNKKAINITNKVTKKDGFFVGMKKKVIPVFSGAIMACSLFSTQVMAATDTSSVTQPLDNLKTLVIAIIGAVGVIILARMLWNLHRRISNRILPP